MCRQRGLITFWRARSQTHDRRRLESVLTEDCAEDLKQIEAKHEANDEEGERSYEGRRKRKRIYETNV